MDGDKVEDFQENPGVTFLYLCKGLQKMNTWDFPSDNMWK